MKQERKTHPLIKLNHTCKICKGIIYIGDSVLYKDGPYHIDCLIQQKQKEAVENYIQEYER